MKKYNQENKHLLGDIQRERMTNSIKQRTKNLMTLNKGTETTLVPWHHKYRKTYVKLINQVI